MLSKMKIATSARKCALKSDDFEFRQPFYYEKTHPDRPLCMNCFHQGKIVPMGERGMHGVNNDFCRCLVCGNAVEVERHQVGTRGPGSSNRGGPGGWMAR